MGWHGYKVYLGPAWMKADSILARRRPQLS